MKLHLSGITIFSVCLLAAWTARGQQPSAANSTSTASPSALSVNGPATPENHFHLAEYFRDLAAREQALAKSYEEIAKMYKAKLSPAGVDAETAREIKNQYRRLAETEKKAAQAALTVAQYHAHLAELVAHLPVEAARQPNPQDAAYRR